jgi:hypothetical protein
MMEAYWPTLRSPRLRTVPVRIGNLSDAEALEAQLIELSIVGKNFSLSLCAPTRRLYISEVPGLD